MPKIKLTAQTVKNLKPPPPPRQLDYWDEKPRGFGVRVSHGGSKTWIVQRRVIRKGKKVPSRVTLGRFPEMGLAEARQAARKVMVDIDDGVDVNRVSKAKQQLLMTESENTFLAVAERFLEIYPVSEKLRPATLAEYKRILLGSRTEAWHHIPVSKIKRADLKNLQDDLATQISPVTSNRSMAYLSGFFSWCLDREIISSSPAVKIRLAKETSRERYLSKNEIVEVWSAFEQLDFPFGAIGKLLLLTGQRRGEVAGMTWSELEGLDGDAPIWRIPAERAKNGREHTVPLAPQAVGMLHSIPRDDSHPFIFGNRGTSPASGFSKKKKELDKIIAERRAEVGISEVMPPWTWHDLRRTFSTHLHGSQRDESNPQKKDSRPESDKGLGVMPHIIEAILNHISGHKSGVGGVYNKANYYSEKRDALVRWATHVDVLIRRSKGENVIAMPSPGKK